MTQFIPGAVPPKLKVDGTTGAVNLYPPCFSIILDSVIRWAIYFFNKTAENSCLLKIYCCPAMQLTQNNQVKSFYHGTFLQVPLFIPTGQPLIFICLCIPIRPPWRRKRWSNQRKSGTNCLAITVVHYQKLQWWGRCHLLLKRDFRHVFFRVASVRFFLCHAFLSQ